MSHSKERQEKICLNCKAELTGRFCHLCGQENLEPKESAWSLISHFFYDITHFDGKFFSTLGYLMRKPGFLSKEYLLGRRASYLNPIRMYVFSSALFFIIFFSMYNVRDWNMGSKKNDKSDDAISNLADAKQVALENVQTSADSIRVEQFYKTLETGIPKVDKKRKDSTNEDKGGWNIQFNDAKYKTRAAYDSVQKAKPASQRDGWISRRITEKFIDLDHKYEGDEGSFLKDLLDKFIHTFPYLLFVSLPLYALFLKLLYIRRKQFFYVDHGIFLVHLYIFTFIVLLIFFGFSKLSDVTSWGWVGIVMAVIMIYGVVYTMKAMRNFYGQGWGKTIVKFILLNLLAFISLIFLFAVFFVLTVFRI